MDFLRLLCGTIDRAMVAHLAMRTGDSFAAGEDTTGIASNAR